MLGVTGLVQPRAQATPDTKAGDVKDGKSGVEEGSARDMTQCSWSLKMLGVAGVSATSAGFERGSGRG